MFHNTFSSEENDLAVHPAIARKHAHFWRIGFHDVHLVDKPVAEQTLAIVL